MLVSLAGDLFRAGDRRSLFAFSALAAFLACVLFRGVGLIVSSAYDMSIPPLALISSPPFILHEIEQYLLLSL